MTTSVNPTLTTAEYIFKDLVWTPMIIAGETWLNVEVPILNVPIIHQAEEIAEDDISDDIFNAIILFVDITYLKLKNSSAQSAYESASENLFVIYTESGVNSSEYKTARDAARIDLGKILSNTT